MTKKRKDARPTAVNVDLPVFIPNDKGETTIEVGVARLRYGTLVVEFKDTAGSVAIQRMIERGVLMGLGMIMVKPDEVNEQYQEVLENEDLQADARRLLAEDDARLLADSSEDRPDDTDVDS